MSQSTIQDFTSPGVARAQAISSCITTLDRLFIFAGVFVIAFAYLLDLTLRASYQPAATANLGVHSLQATVSVIQSVTAIATQLASAKIADIFRRVELISASIAFYVIGTVTQATAPNIQTFAGGSVIYQIAYTMIILLVEVIAADVTSTRARVFFSYISAMPFLITTWISGNIAKYVLDNNHKLWRWRWGIGMFAIIYTASALPLILSLCFVTRRAKQQGKLCSYPSFFSTALGIRGSAVQLFWLLDIIGLFLIFLIFGLVLAPLTLAGGAQSRWSEPKIIAPLLLGVMALAMFVLWERATTYPLVPFQCIRSRATWAAIGLGICYNLSYAMQSDFLYTIAQVAFDFNVEEATRLTSLYSFTSIIIGPFCGLIAFKTRRLKFLVVLGTTLYMVGFGLLFHYRGRASSKVGVIGAQVFLGASGGLFPYSTQALLQASLHHEQLAAMTAAFLAMSSVGSALGNAVTGAIWSQLLPGKLERHLGPINSTLPAAVYADPFAFTVLYPMGSPERVAIVESYKSLQQVFLVVGLCICVPLVVFSLLLRNPKLGSTQTLAAEPDAAANNTMQGAQVIG